ncbi:MAG: SMI1/KNR4 family protein [Clostridia bacterium]|nr:SMI1/KNR4 family protein [Clostridia bacterium]
MNIDWKYAEKVADLSVFDEIGEMMEIDFPEELKELILAANASMPSPNKFTVGGKERVLGEILAFTHDEEEDSEDVFSTIEDLELNNIIPFAVDPFGNYIGYSVTDGKVVFYDHECDEMESTGKSLSEFINSLY